MRSYLRFFSSLFVAVAIVAATFFLSRLIPSARLLLRSTDKNVYICTVHGRLSFLLK